MAADRQASSNCNQLALLDEYFIGGGMRLSTSLLLASAASLTSTSCAASSSTSPAFLSGASASTAENHHPVRRPNFGRRSSWAEYERKLATALKAGRSVGSDSAVVKSNGKEQSEDQQAEEAALSLNQARRNRQYLSTLSLNLASALQSYKDTFREGDMRRAINILKQMEREVILPDNADCVDDAKRMCQLAGLDLNKLEEEEADDDEDTCSNESSKNDDGDVHIDSDSAKRKAEAEERRRWEATRPGGISPGMNTIHPGEYTTTNRMQKNGNGDGNAKSMAEGVKSGINQPPMTPLESPMGASRDRRAQSHSQSQSQGRSILSTRSATDTAFLSGMDERLASDNKKSFPGNVVATGGKASSRTPGSTNPSETANDIQEFRESMASSSSSSLSSGKNEGGGDNIPISRTGEEQASELVALAGAGNAFEGSALGIGGLDDVLNQIKRRVWVPLAAPPSLLAELGISPVRGLLLYGLPGCGKTLLARSIGKILSPARPITVVSGPEIMDRFVGSSESNLREIFDSPPPIVDSYRVQYPDMGAALEKNALHVVIMDEFDSIARSRGGGDGKGSQGDAGVARDSVVNQMLAKMDGVDPLPVPTLVVGLTNKRSLIDPALLRPGRFEVHIEVTKPKTKEARISILKVHLNSMMESGRLLVSDPPPSTAAARVLESGALSNEEQGRLLSFEQLVDLLAVESDGFTGASLAAVARAAASHALERAVMEIQDGGSIADCLVTQEDFELAIDDCIESEGDGGEDEDGDEDEEVEAKEDAERNMNDDEEDS